MTTVVDLATESTVQELNQQDIMPVPPTTFSPLSDVDAFPTEEQSEDTSFCPLNDW